MGYADAFELQQRLVAARKKDAAPDVLLLCEHPPTITLGRNGDLRNLRMSREGLSQLGIEFHHANRGGDITYHGPGQIVGYPILQLGEIRRDVGWYVRQLEEAMIRATAAFGIAAFRVAGRTGVWTRAKGMRAETALEEQKLGAIGVHLSRWVTAHGFAYNVSTDLSYFDLIVPCGIAGCRATSLEKLIDDGRADGRAVDSGAGSAGAHCRLRRSSGPGIGRRHARGTGRMDSRRKRTRGRRQRILMRRWRAS